MSIFPGDYPKNTNPEVLDAGLVAQSGTPISCNEWGGREMVQTFKLWNKDYPAKEPAKRALHEVYAFLAAAGPSRLVDNGHAPDIAIIDVTYRGAVFPLLQLLDGTDVTAPYQTNELSSDFITLPLFTDSVLGALPNGSALVNYDAIQLSWHYIAKLKPVAPLFALSTYIVDETHPAPIIAKVTLNSGAGLPLFLGGDATPPVIDQAAVLEACDVVAELNQFTSVPWGIYFDVTESVKITYQIKPATFGGIFWGSS